MARLRLLDLFCGVGGAGHGYHLAGFQVVGVDIEPQPNYPYALWVMDAMPLLAGRKQIGGVDLEDFDVIHASPPCQSYAQTRHLPHAGEYPSHLAQCIRSLNRIGVPYVVENVCTQAARDDMAEAPHITRLCGSSFGLRVRRHRLFASSMPLQSLPCDHPAQAHHLVGVYGASDGERSRRASENAVKPYKYPGRDRGPRQATTDEAREVMQIPWARTRRELTEAIPPVYTWWIGEQLR